MIACGVRCLLEFLRGVGGPYSANMRSSGVLFFSSIVRGATAASIQSAERNWAGDYADKNLLDGQAVFQMSIEQSRNAI
jgi:hypothetical protein